MFGKFAANIKRAGKGSHGSKYKIDVQITQLENLPAYVKKVRVVWSRSAKVQMTDFKDTRGSKLPLRCSLSCQHADGGRALHVRACMPHRRMHSRRR